MSAPPTVDDTPVTVDPFIGSGGVGYSFGSAFPGALSPQGLCKVGPDTTGPLGKLPFLHYDGYWYGDPAITGFSHLHLSGTGAADLGVLSLMPVIGFDATKTTSDGRQSRFDKKKEIASPGYYSVVLDKDAIKVELTATQHAAHHRYTYPAGASPTVVFDLDHHLESGVISAVDVKIDAAAGRIHGRFHSVGGMSRGFGGYDVYFEARTKSEWQRSLVWHDGIAPAEGQMTSGAAAGFALQFAPSTEPIEVQVGLSYSSAENAAQNLAMEMPDFDFDKTRKRTEGEWSAVLGLITVEGGTADARRLFVSSLYHAFLMPTRIDDADGTYVGQDKMLHKADGFHYCSDMSLWDTYRTVNPLYSLIAPDRERDVVRSLVEMEKASGFFSKWPMAVGEAGTMLGASAEIVIADAYVKGITDFDAMATYQKLRSAAMDPNVPRGSRGGRDDVDLYMQYGYVPASRNRSVSVTTEYGNDDFALANFAAALGRNDDAKALMTRRTGYRKLFDPDTGFLWARFEDGHFASNRQDFTGWQPDFAEANAWQSVWMAQHDIDGLMTLFGGQQPFVDKLTSFFEQGKTDYEGIGPNDNARKTTPRNYYWAGNEPDIHAAFLFSQAGRPDLAQKWVQWARSSTYSTAPDGLPGNDDGGTISSWYVWASLGLYPIAGSDRYAVAAPAFSHIALSVKGGTFNITAKGVSAANLYVQSATLNGSPLSRAEVRHSDLKAGGTLEFVMGAAPSNWGRN